MKIQHKQHETLKKIEITKSNIRNYIKISTEKIEKNKQQTQKNENFKNHITYGKIAKKN